MTVEELIEKLEKFPKDYTVKVTRDGIDSDLYESDSNYWVNDDRKEVCL